MSNPAQPCFVWQIYDYSLEPFASFFAVTTKAQTFTSGGRSGIAPNTNAIVIRPAPKVVGN
jgi:hypothetical protein